MKFSGGEGVAFRYEAIHRARYPERLFTFDDGGESCSHLSSRIHGSTHCIFLDGGSVCLRFCVSCRPSVSTPIGKTRLWCGPGRDCLTRPPYLSCTRGNSDLCIHR